MNTKHTITPETIFIGEASKPFAAGDILYHPRVDELSVYNYMKALHADVVLEPIAAGTELYERYGTGCTYIVSLEAPTQNL